MTKERQSSISPRRIREWRRRLNALAQRYDRRELSPDPLEFPRRFQRSDDREVVGLVASALAYGNVRTICNSLERVVTWLGPKPAGYARTMDPREGLRSLGRFQHRWSRGADVVCLVHFAGQMLELEGSVGAFFARRRLAGDLATSIESFSRDAVGLDHGGLYRAKGLPAKAGVRYFFTSPQTGACKRLNMFLRWMVRPDDGLDFGLWSFMHPRELLVPLDTHIHRIGLHLGWTERRTPGWKAAEEITDVLKRLDPEDPIRYDFALSRMGIRENCPRHAPDLECDLCRLRSVA